MQYCSLQHQIYIHHQSHPQLGVVFALAPSLFLSGVISPLISRNISGTYQPGEFIFQCPIFLAFHTVNGALKAKILKWFAIPFCGMKRQKYGTLKDELPRLVVAQYST